MNNIIRLIVHLFFAGLTLFYFVQCNKMMPHENFWLRLWNQHVFLTNLTHTLVTIYYLIVLYQDIMRIFNKQSEKESQSLEQYTYPSSTHNYFQLVLSLSMIVGFGYWSMMIVDPKLLWGDRDPEAINFFYMMYYLHGGNHLHLYLEILLYKQHIILDSICLSIYFTITAIQYFYFGKVVYNFQNLGIHIMIPIYVLSIIAFTAFDFGFQAVSIKLGLFDVAIPIESNKYEKLEESIEKNDKKIK